MGSGQEEENNDKTRAAVEVRKDSVVVGKGMTVKVSEPRKGGEANWQGKGEGRKKPYQVKGDERLAGYKKGRMQNEGGEISSLALGKQQKAEEIRRRGWNAQTEGIWVEEKREKK